MTGAGATAALLDGGLRLHLQHGPIDLILGADGAGPQDRARAFAAATARFQTVLAELVAELPLLRRAVTAELALPKGVVAGRMRAAVAPHADRVFVTAMAAVAGAVADEILAAMTAAAPLQRAYVNNGGDIALHLGPGAQYVSAIAGLDGGDLGRITLDAGAGIGGIATSGAGGRSLSFGIADSVTVLAASAAAADAAATLIANAVDLPGHAGILRVPANTLQPDSDLGARLVVRAVPALAPAEAAAALAAGLAAARAMRARGLIAGAALFLQGQSRMTGPGLALQNQLEEVAHA